MCTISQITTSLTTPMTKVSFLLPARRLPTTSKRYLVALVLSAGLLGILVIAYALADNQWEINTLFTLTTGDSKSNSGTGVVLLTGVTYERLSVFAGVENIYEKIWENRQGYASAHGINPFSTF